MLKPDVSSLPAGREPTPEKDQDGGPLSSSRPLLLGIRGILDDTGAGSSEAS